MEVIASQILWAAAGIPLGYMVASATRNLPARMLQACDVDARAHLGIVGPPSQPPPMLAPIGRGGRRDHVIALLASCCTAAAGLLDNQVMLAAGLVLVLALLALAVIDFESMLLPDFIVLPLLWAGLLLCASQVPALAADHVMAAAGAYLLLRLAPGVAEGDAKLAAAGGAWIGLQALPIVGVVAGAACCVQLLLLWRRGQDLCARHPFGPALAIGIGSVWLGLQLNLL